MKDRDLWRLSWPAIKTGAILGLACLCISQSILLTMAELHGYAIISFSGALLASTATIMSAFESLNANFAFTKETKNETI